MNIRNRIKNATRVLLAKNSLTNLPLSKRFWKYGNKPLIQNWSQTIMSDEDMYVGYGYAVINKRANKTAQLANKSLKTKGSKTVMDKAKQADEDVEHPYLEILDTSPTFTNYQFWHTISTYLDLEGVYYLMALRNFNGERYGEIQEFKLLNPFEVKRIKNETTGEIGGYAEYRSDGRYREIPKEMIIEMRELNPFNRDEPFGLSDAAKDSQYTLKQSGDHTRHAIQKSLNSPGIVTIGDSDIELDEEKFANFKARIQGHEKGEPIYGIGKGSIAWNDMQIDLNKSALTDVNEINLKSLIAVSGASKTLLGIEESGVTRDTSKVQKDLFTEDQAIPRLQTIIDALNQDYKNHYKEEYQKTEYVIYIDNPLGSDHDAEIKDAGAKQAQYDLYIQLLDAGFDNTLAGKFIEGEIMIDELGVPTKKEEAPVEPVKEKPVAKEEEPVEPVEKKEHIDSVVHEKHVETALNELGDEQQGILTSQQGALQNSIATIEQRLVATMIDNITNGTKNAIETEDELISKKEKTSFLNEVDLALLAFFSIVIPLYATQTISKRNKETGKLAAFNYSPAVKRDIARLSTKIAKSHLDTIVSDVYAVVRAEANASMGVTELVNLIRKEYTDTISKIRAKTIARTETNRAFTLAQFEADKQFIKMNKLEGRVYKQWVTRSPTPCAYCVGLSQQAPIPFDNNFADLGDELSYSFTKKDGTTVLRKMAVDFEPLSAGTAHPNCACTYRLIIE